jgi:hypothetical protein
MTRKLSIAICITGLSLPGCGASPLGSEGDTVPQSDEAQPGETRSQQDALYTSPDCLLAAADHTMVTWGHHYTANYVDHGGGCRYESIVDVLSPASGYRAGFVTQPMEIPADACANTKMFGKVWGWNGTTWVSLYETPNAVRGWMDHQICQAFLETPPLNTNGISIVRMVGHSENWVLPIGIASHWMPFT